jgi:hypothetical protein
MAAVEVSAESRYLTKFEFSLHYHTLLNLLSCFIIQIHCFELVAMVQHALHIRFGLPVK